MPIYTVEGPDGRIYEVEGPEGATNAQVIAAVRRQIATQPPAAQPQSGFLPALKAGATELGGGISALMGKVGLKDEAKAEAEYQAAKKRAAEIFKPTEEGWTEAPITKFTELLGGSLPYMAAPLAAGAAAATLPFTGTAAAVAGLGAAGLTSAGQFTATNLARQMEGEEGTMPKKRLAETDLSAAALAAIPQAALDTLSMRMIPGIGRMFGQAGVKVTAETAKDIAEQGLKKTLIDYTAKTGKAAGIEGLTESAQQVFERLQAGLNITDEKAREEYFNSFIGGAVLGGALAPAGRYVERGREQREARGLLESQAAEERKAAAAAEAAKKAQPDYILGIADQYDALNKQKSDLMAQIVKGSKEAPLSQEDKDRNTLIQQQLKELEPQIKEQRKEYLSLGGPDVVEKLREQKRIEAMTPEEYAEYSYAQRAVPGKPRATAPETEETLSADFADPLAVYEKGPSQPVLDYVAAQMRTAQRLDQGNFDVNDYAQFLIQDPAMAQRVVAERPAIPGVSKQESDAILDGLKLQLEALGGEMAAGREAAGYERQQTDIEQQVAREQAARLAATQQQLGLEGAAEREAMQELAADRASDMRARELQALQTARQTALFPEGTEIDTRPKGTLPERLNTLTERILAAPNVDDATKDLAQQVRDNLPQVAAQLQAQTEALAQRAPQRGVAPRVTPRGVAQGDEVTQIADWAQSVLQGRAAPEMTADLRAAVQALQAGQRSETEQVTQYAGRALTAQEKQDVAGTSLEGRQGVMTREPTGEVRRAVQTDIAMPEPTAKAFESFGAFNDYLASEGLQAYRTQKGLVFPTLSNLQKRLAPIQARVAELQKQLDDVNAKREALQKADAAERGAASALLRESQQKLQATVQSLDDTARTTYVGQKFKQVDLVDLLDQAHGRLNAALSHSANLRNQFAEALRKIASAEDAAQPVMVDAKGNATTKEKDAVRTVAKGQLPGYQALRKAQLDLQEKGLALVKADQTLEQVVKAGIGQSWDAGSPTLNAYLKAKKAKDEAQRAAQQAHFAMLQAHRRIPSTEALNNNLSKFLAEKSSIDTEMAKAAKSLSAIRLGVRNASNRLNDSYVRMENNPELRFGENLLRLRQDLLAAQNISEEVMGRSVERQAQAGALAKEAKVIAQPMRTMGRQVETALSEARERAEKRRGVPTEETQAEREARDAQTRREEQARLERQEAIPATRIEFERAETDNQETNRLAEAVGTATTAEERAAARKAFDEHLKALVARKDAELDDMKRRAAKNVQDLNTQRKAVAELTERLKGDLTPKRRESAEKQLAEAKRKLAEHERRYTLNTREMKIKRTDIQAQREERNRLLAEALGRREEGERLGVAEGTQQRALSPVTGAKTIPPKKMFTGSAESKAGATTTDTRQRLVENRGEKQRDIAIKQSEQAEANRIAEALRKQTPEQKAAAEKEEAEVQKEQAKLQSKPKKITPLRSEKASKLKGEVISESESVEEDFEPEILGGPNEEVFFSRGATPNPSTTDTVRTELKAAFPDLGRVQIYDSVDALIAANPQYEGKIPSDARGFVDTAGNKAFLIAENINQGQALSVLLHEVGAHIGLKNMLGQAQYNALVNAVKSWEKRTDNSTEAKVAKAARVRVEAAETTPGQVNDELLAYAIEEAVNAGVKPGQTKGVIGQWLSQIAQLFRNALSRFGLPPKALDAQGIVDMAFGAAKMEMRGQGALAPRAQIKVPISETFKRWFGSSKVVDAEGRPLVVYHGSNADITAFDPAKLGSATEAPSAQLGFFFASEPSVAASYAQVTSGYDKGFIGAMNRFTGGFYEWLNESLLKGISKLPNMKHWEPVGRPVGGNVLPVYLSLQNPLEVDQQGKEYREQSYYDILARAKAEGHDGVIIRNTFDEGFEAGGNKKTDIYVVFNPTQIKSATGNRGTYDPTNPNILFSRNLPTAARVADQLVGQQKGWLQKLRENYLGMGGRAQFVDMRFPLEEALKKGGVEDLDAVQAMYYVRMYDQKMHFTSEAITEGVPEVVEKTRKDGRTERIIEAKAGANLTQAYKILTSKEVVKAAGSPDAANKLVTLYMAAIRGANKGYDKLNFGRAWATEEIKRLDGQIKAKDTTPEERTNLQKRRNALTDRLDTMPTPEDIKASRAEIEANPVLRDAFDKVREVYNEYNRNLLNLAVQTGAISKDHARTLLAQNDYIPYYRMRGGVAEMVIGDETPIRIGNIKDNQELQELVGGDEPILDFITSSMQNTSMLVDMSLRNIAMKNAMFELRDVGLATVAKAPKGGAPKGSVTFKKDGEDYYAVVNTDALGISSDLLVKGLAGIPTMFPMWVRAMGVPARILRRAIVAAPPYWAKQVFRDSLGAAMSSGANITPVLGALRQIGKDNVLERRGITGGQVFTGLPEDKKRMLDAMQAGKVSLARGMAWLEATSAKADALTRKNQYESYLQQGLSEMEATYMALESMNFSKRGLSPSVHYANILIPFFNSQIQGLDALYKTFTGKMPMNERLAIRQKLWERGMLMFAMSMAYAWAMQDDETYRNAKPDEKYSNWFVPLKNFGIDATLRVPIPFELGYIFKALPEAIVNSMMREEGAKEARDAFLHIAQQTVPGGSSLGMPAAVKPGIETVLGVSSYTGRPIESAQEQMLEPGYRTRENTTELARQIGEALNFSPIKLEYLVRGYTGSMGMAALAALSAPLGGTGPEPATKRLTDTPVFGTMFQPKDASGIIDATYERLNKVNQLVKTHEDLLSKGRVADAEKYFKEHQDDMVLGSLAGSFKEYMGQITKFERDIRVSTMSPDAKREKLEQARQMKIRLAESVRDTIKAAGDRKTPQASLA